MITALLYGLLQIGVVLIAAVFIFVLVAFTLAPVLILYDRFYNRWWAWWWDFWKTKK